MMIFLVKLFCENNIHFIAKEMLNNTFSGDVNVAGYCINLLF